MTRIESKFKQLKKEKKKALIPFFFAGDPDLDITYELVLELEKAGADIVELGIPYTDPLADGPVNQAAAARALKNNIKIHDIIDLVRRIRKVSDIPIAFLLYFNCVMRCGVAQFLRDCEDAGVDGLVIPDLPSEEKDEYRAVFGKYNVDLMDLVTPISGARIKDIVKDSSGFVYCVTSTGVTGVRQEFATDFSAFLDDVKKYTETPRVLGFGISTPEQVSELKDYAEGVIVGSAIVRKMETDREAIIDDVTTFVRELKDALE